MAKGNYLKNTFSTLTLNEKTDIKNERCAHFLLLWHYVFFSLKITYDDEFLEEKWRLFLVTTWAAISFFLSQSLHLSSYFTLFICLSMSLSNYQSVHFISMLICLSIAVSVRSVLSVSIYLYLPLSNYQSVHIYAHLPQPVHSCVVYLNFIYLNLLIYLSKSAHIYHINL